MIDTVWGRIILQNIFAKSVTNRGVKSILSVEANVDSKREPENTNVVGAGNRAALRGSLLRRTLNRCSGTFRRQIPTGGTADAPRQSDRFL